MQASKTTFYLILIIAVCMVSSCCRNDDAPIQTISLRIQFFNSDKSDNLFDADGPLIQSDISFEYGRDGNILEDVSFESNGTFNLFLSEFGSLAFDQISGANSAIFINRLSGERDSLFVFTETVTSGRCNNLQIFLREIEFNTTRQSAEEGRTIELVLE